MGSNGFFDFGIAGPFEGAVSGAAGVGTGFGGGLGSIFSRLLSGVKSNPDLLAQYLSGMGAGLNNGGVAGMTNNMNSITQNTIATRHYADALRRVLGGDMSGGAKVAMDENGLSIKVPQGQDANANDATAGSPQSQGKRNIGDLMSPFQSGLPNFSASDLAGLTPEMLGQVIGMKMSKDQAVSNRELELLDQQYKAANLEVMKNYYDAQVKNMESDNEQNRLEGFRKLFDTLRGDTLDQPFIMPYKGNKITIREWNALPKEEQEYAIHLNEAGDKALSREEFKLLDPTERENFLVKAMKNPKLMAAAKELARAGASSINLGPMATEIEKGKGKGIAEVTAPGFEAEVRKGIGNVAFKYPEQLEALVTKKAAKDEAEAKTMLERHYVSKAIEDSLIQAYGSVGKKVDRGSDGWYVDGKIVRRFPK